mgnify:CR=1 FL=1
MQIDIFSKEVFLPMLKRRKRLFITKEQLHSIQSELGNEPFNFLWNRFLNEITARIETIIPALPAGNSDSLEKIISYYSVFRNCMNDLLNSSFAFLITKNNKFAELARKRIKTILSWRTWVHPAHYPKTIDLVSSEIIRTLAVACEWLGSSLPVDEKKAVFCAVEKRVIEQYITGMMNETGWWARECTTNWCAVVNGGIGSALLYFLDDDKLLADVLNEVLRRLSIYLKGFEPDGGWREGVMYWTYGITWYLYFSDAVENATQGKINCAKIPQMKNAIAFPIYSFLPPDRMVNFCDALPKSNPGMAIPMLKLARVFNNSFLMNLALRIIKESEESPNPFLLIWLALCKIEKTIHRIPLSKTFRKIEWSIMRSSWNDDAIILAAKGGYADPYEHTHLDAGTFILHAFGKPLIIDIGKGEYSLDYFSPKRWQNTYANTHGHNTFLIDGDSQLPGRKHEGKITDFRKSVNFSYTRMDITSCYNPEKVKSIIRHFVLMKNGACLILDEIDCKQGISIESRFHFSGNGKLINDSEFELINGNACLNLKTLSQLPLKLIKSVHSEPDTFKLKDKEFVSAVFCPPKSGFITVTYLYPHKSEQPAPQMLISSKASLDKISILINIDGDCLTLIWIHKNGKNILDCIL